MPLFAAFCVQDILFHFCGKKLQKAEKKQPDNVALSLCALRSPTMAFILSQSPTGGILMPSTPPYQSRLIPYRKEIFRMWYNERATLKTIQTFLNRKSVSISLSALSRFIKRQRQQSAPHDLPDSKSTRLLNGRSWALSALEDLIGENNTGNNRE